MDGGFAAKKVPRRSRNEKQDDLQLSQHSASETRQPVNLASSPLSCQPPLRSESPSSDAADVQAPSVGSSSEREPIMRNLRGIGKETSGKYRSDERRLQRELKNVTRSTDSFKEFSSLQPLSRRTVARSALGDRSRLQTRGNWGDSATPGEEPVPNVAIDQNTVNIPSTLSPPSPVPQQSRLRNFFSSVARGTSNGSDSAILANDGKNFISPASSLFGVSLEELALRSGYDLPPQISNLIVTLREHLHTEGIFRMSAAMRDVQLLRVAVEKGDAQAIETASVHSQAGVLIAFLSELPEPLVGFTFYEEALAIAALPETPARTTTLEALLVRLSRPSFVLLRQLAQLWQATERLSGMNKMGAANLAVVFGPLVLRPAQAVLDMRLIALQNAFVEAVIRFSNELFSDITSSVP